MKLKVTIIDRCDYCDGEASPFAVECHDEYGGHPVYRPWYQCKGSREIQKQVTPQEFANLLNRAVAMEPNWGALRREKPIAQMMDSRDAAGMVATDHNNDELVCKWFSFFGEEITPGWACWKRPLPPAFFRTG